jgi:hypothetical protein
MIMFVTSLLFYSHLRIITVYCLNVHGKGVEAHGTDKGDASGEGVHHLQVRVDPDASVNKAGLLQK